MPKQNPIDAETLAALLDGKLSDVDAAMVRDQLSHADQDTIDAYMDAVAVHAELAGDLSIEDAPPTRDIPTSVRFKRFPSRFMIWSAPVVFSAAAALVFVVKSRDESSVFPPATYSLGPITQLSDNATTVWGVERGTVIAAAEKKSSARIGALLADFEAASGEDAKAIARSLAALLGTVGGGQIVAAPYLQFATSDDARMDDATRRETGITALKLVDNRYAVVGAYFESCRLATMVRSDAFSTRKAPEQISEILRDTELGASTRSQIQAAIDALGVHINNWSSLETACADALRSITH